MKKLFQRLFVALCVAALPLYAIADYTATQGAGTTIFAFVCQSTKVCPAHTLITSGGVEIMTGASPGFVTLTNSNVTVSQPTAASLNATVVGTGTFAVQAAQSGTWNVTNISGTVSLPTGASTSANQTSQITQETATAAALGTTADTVCSTDTGTCTIEALIKRTNQNISTLNTSVNSSIPAGTNLIGAVTVQAAAVSGFTTLTMANLLTTPNAIKASAGQVAKLYCYNPNATVAYVQIFNVASGSVTPGTTKPSQTYGIPATNAAGFSMSPVGDQYSTAISAIATTSASNGTPPGTGLDCSVSFN